jgi:hypothetical protein
MSRTQEETRATDPEGYLTSTECYPNLSKVLFKQVTGGYTWSIWSNGQDEEDVFAAIEIVKAAHRELVSEFGDKPPARSH